ncbi:hypothetical protein C7974DRAFT_403342 [Boeremia exigua]|uniref:uncharacterized protein n=1 Tax=Boeremia exigua TaxID=749465 RepID=UPI001E8DA6AE|nr:uncharacterized protein C7974DRAFT_403342 [Boeremia exigua]KAH6615131.1 hypothetical protein C7974DRAFT_403342 [Boeremia exigua]
MPRQLPWKSGNRTQTIKTTKRPNDIDEDSIDGTRLSGGNKSKGRAKASVSPDSLPELSSGPSPAKNTDSKRATSSSPPPLAEDALSNAEPIRKGVSKFDLRDDEWMMVEDEFLETAKLFTRHLRIAEYDRLKETIEAKKKEAETARPVVLGAKRSEEGAMKERVRLQDSKQKKAIRDVFASQGDSSGDDKVSRRPRPSRTILAVKPRTVASQPQDTDSDDLDAPRPSKPRVAASASTANLKEEPAPRPFTTSFAIPAIPAPTASGRPRMRPSRMTPFDMLDAYTPPSKPPSQPSSSPHSPQPAKPTQSRRSLDLFDEREPLSGASKEAADRLAKRKTERGDGGPKKKTTRIDDIPTFLF